MVNDDPLYDFGFFAYEVWGYKDKAIAIYQESARKGSKKAQDKLRQWE